MFVHHHQWEVGWYKMRRHWRKAHSGRAQCQKQPTTKYVLIHLIPFSILRAYPPVWLLLVSSTARKPFIMKNILSLLGLTGPMVLLMVKGALPPTIATAMTLSPSVSGVYGNFGFLMTVASILSLHLLPRNRFVQNLVLATFLTCLAASWTLLAHFLGIKARQHTNSEDPLRAHNSAASAINAVFLFLAVWLLSSLRAAYQQFTIPLLICTIFCLVGIMLGPRILVEESAQIIVRQLLTSYLTGFGLSAVVSLALFPRTCRSLFLMRSRSFLITCQQLLESQQKLFESPTRPTETEQSLVEQNLRSMSSFGSAVASIMSQLSEELKFAEAEVAIGYQSPEMLNKTMLHLQALLVPLLGLSRLGRIDHCSSNKSPTNLKSAQVVKLTSKCFEETREVFEKAVSHAMPIFDDKSSTMQGSHSNLERQANLNSSNPGDLGFSNFLMHRLETFGGYRETKIRAMRDSAFVEGEGLPKTNQEHESPTQSNIVFKVDEKDVIGLEAPLNELQHHIFIQHMLGAVSKAACELAEYSESMQASSETKRRLVFPIFERWISDVRMAVSTLQVRRRRDRESLTVFELARDPEHRLPTSSLESIGDRVRYFLRLFLSDSSKFGLRVAAATLSLGIIGFLPQSQQFFVEYRLVWAMVMTPISMSPTSGNAIYGFASRVAGTAFAMVMAFANWYIVNGNLAGVVVFFFVSMLVYYYFLLRFPRFIVIFILAAVNHVLIVGYELQTNANDAQTATMSGPLYFPLYILAPYRLLSVIAGLLVALFWTVVPTQISEHSILHAKINTSLSLLVRYCGLVSGTPHQRVHALEGDLTSESSPGRLLKSARYKTLFQELALLAEMRDHSAMTVYEVSMGGKFPKEEYDVIIEEVQRMVALLSVVAYVSQAFQGRENNNEGHNSALTRSEHQIYDDLMAIIPVISIIASSMVSGSSLPPRPTLELGKNNDFSGSATDEEAVIAIVVAVAGMVQSVEKIIQAMKSLVGELSFGTGYEPGWSDGEATT